jgi:hypothetical protein
MTERWLTPEQVAADPRLPRGNADWVRKQLRAGRLRGSLIDGRWYVAESAIDEMFTSADNDPRKRKRRRVA